MPISSATTVLEETSKEKQWELADIFREYGEAYRNFHSLPLEHLKVMHAIEVCRTSHLGGHMYKCDTCGYEHPVYNSCGNRHCPKCQTMDKEQWLAERKSELLPVGYFHVVFTLPHLLNLLVRCNKQVIYDILFKSVSETLLEFGRNPKNGLGGQIGFIAILHTWTQTLLEHIHLHCIVPAGALSFDKKQWIHPKNPDFLFSVRALSKLFRGKFIELLEKAFAEGKLIFHGEASQFETIDEFRALIKQLWKTDWVVYSKKPFAGPEQVLNYLGRYTHRVAISNNRIKKVENGQVTFTWRDRRDNNRLKEMTVSVEEFIRRFLLHILPESFTRIRYFGFLSNRYRKQNISRCRELLGLNPQIPAVEKQSSVELILRVTGKDLSKCPKCKTGTLVYHHLIPKDESYLHKQKEGGGTS